MKFQVATALALIFISSIYGKETIPESDAAGLEHFPENVDIALARDFSLEKARFQAAYTMSLRIIGIDVKEWRTVLNWGYAVVITSGSASGPPGDLLEKYAWCEQYNQKLMDRIRREQPMHPR